MSGVIAKRYRIDSPLDGSSSVFQAYDLRIQRAIAVKMLPAGRLEEDSFVERFLEQATAAARLSHPNVVQVYDVTEYHGRQHVRKASGRDPVIVMEFVPGQNLDYHIRSRQPVPSEESTSPLDRKIDLILQVCRALQYGHEQGLLHGAVSPSNIRIKPSGEAKLLNFGIAPVTRISPSLFASPEQCAGSSDIDRRSDVFSLGMVMCRLFANRLSVQRASESPRLDELAGECPAPILRVIRQALEIDPADRFADCREMETALREIRSGPSQPAGGIGSQGSRPVGSSAEARILVDEARKALAAEQIAVASLLAYQALQIDPTISDAAEIFEQTQETLRERREGQQTALVQTTALPDDGPDTVRHQPPPPPFLPPKRQDEVSADRSRPFLGSRGRLLLLPIALGVLLLVGLWWAAHLREAGPAPVAAGQMRQLPEQPAATGKVSLDVVPWARVESVVRVRDGRAMEVGALETPCVITLPAGRYMVIVSHPDFGSRQFPIDVRGGEVHSVEHSLLSRKELERELAPR